MNARIEKYSAEFRKALKVEHNPERAEFEKRYLKSPYECLGVGLPRMRTLIREFGKRNKELSREEVLALSERLWTGKYHQEKTLAIMLLEEYSQFLDMEIMPLLKRMLEESTGWDHVDAISIHLVGAILGKEKDAFQCLKKWAVSGNFWMRRASLISQILLLRKGEGRPELFFRLSEAMLQEKEFFIRKAIGWTIREMSKPDPKAAFNFLMRIKGRASGLTIREGAKRLPEKMKKMVLRKEES